MKKLLLITSALVALGAGPAHAGPVAAAVAWVGKTIAAGGILGAVVQTAIGYGVSILAQALAPKPDAPELSVKFEAQWGDDNPLSFIAGDYVTAGKRKYIGSWGKDTRFITDVIEVSGLPQPGLIDMWVDDELATFTGKIWGIDPNDDPSGFSDQGEYDPGALPAGWISAGRAVSNYSDDGNRIYVKYLDGTQIAADPFLTMVFGSDPDYPWTADMIGTGKSYAIVTTRYDDDTLTSYPAYLFQPDALPMYDIRKDDTAGGVGAHRWGQPETYEPSRNPAVIAYNIIRGISFGSEWVWGGKDLAAWRLPAAEWMAAANECDDPVTLADSSTEPRYRCGMEIDVSMTPADVLEEIGKASNMHFAEVGGMIKPIVGLPGAAAMSITDDSIIITEGQSFKPFYPVSDTFNALSATYPEPGEKWTTRDSPEFIDTDAMESDGGRYLPTSVSYPAAPYGKQVQRLQRAQMQDFRRFRCHQFQLPPEAYALEPGVDMVSWTSERNGYVDKLFVVESVAKTLGMNVLVSLREVDPSDYDWSSGFEMPTNIAAPVNPVPFDQVVGGLLVEPAIVKDAASNDRRAAIKVSCDGDVPGVSNIQIQARVNGQIDIVIDTNRCFADPFAWFLRDVLPNETYDVRVRLLSDRTPKSVWSPWLTVTTPDVRYGWEDLADSVEQTVSDAQAVADQAAADIQAEVNRATQVEADLAAADAQLRSEFESADVLINDRITDAEVNIGSNAAAISDEASIRQSEDALIAGRVTHLESDVGNTGNMIRKSDFSDGTIGEWQAVQGGPNVVIRTGGFVPGVADPNDVSLVLENLTDAGPGAQRAVEGSFRQGDIGGKTIRLAGRANSGLGSPDVRIGLECRLIDGSSVFVMAVVAPSGSGWSAFDIELTVAADKTVEWRPNYALQNGTGTQWRGNIWAPRIEIVDEVAIEARATADQATIVAASNEQSIASMEATWNAEYGSLSAFVNQTATAIADQDNFAAAFFGLTAEIVGGDIVGIKGTTWQDPDGSTGSVLRLVGDTTIVEGSLGAYSLTIFDPDNLVPDNQFQANAAWGTPTTFFSLVNAGGAFSSVGAIRYTHQAGTVFTGYINSRRFSVDNATEYYFSVRTNAVGGSGDYAVNVRVEWFAADGSSITENVIMSAASAVTGITDSEASFTSPNNAQQARIRVRVNRDLTNIDVNIGNIVARAKKPGSTLITPNSITSNEMVANTITSNEINVSQLVGSSAFLNNLVVDTAQIANLAVDTIKINDNAVTVMESAYTAANISNTSRHVVQTLVYTIGRPGPQIIDVHLDLGFGQSAYTGEYRIRVHRDNTVVLYEKDINVPAGAVTTGEQFFIRVIDPQNISGTVTYRVDIQQIEAGKTASAARQRFMGILNAYK